MGTQDMKIHPNRMNLHTIDAFYHINGRFTGFEKDVYFLRYIGTEDEGSDCRQILNGDHLMQAKASAAGAGYCRVKELPRSIPAERLNSYAEGCKDLSSLPEQPGCFYRSQSPSFNRLLTRSFTKVLAFYQKESGANDTMCKNFAVKCFHWIDMYYPQLFPQDGNLSASPKFVYIGPIKLQEYLFLYLLNLCGCDVLYYNSKEDISQSDACKNLSSLHLAARCGELQIPDYAPHPQSISSQEGQNTLSRQPASSGSFVANRNMSASTPFAPASSDTKNHRPVDIHSRPPRHKQRGTAAGNQIQAKSPKQAATGSRTPFTVAIQSKIPSCPQQRQELGFEELAKLASSVVMIGAFDQNGDCFKTGSGVMISGQGYVLTNFHVVSDAQIYSIRMEEEEKAYETNELVKYHPQFDLAILRIPRKCRAIPLCPKNSALARGQKVVAIGSPLGLFNSVSDGIISGFRTLHDVSMIQFTAPISHGSSGGALLNMYGELIGLCTAGFDDGQNLNLAVDYKTLYAFTGNLLHG